MTDVDLGNREPTSEDVGQPPGTGAQAPVRAEGCARRRHRRLRRWTKRAGIAAAVATIIGVVVFAIAWRVWPFPVERLDRWGVSPVVMDREGNVLLRLAGPDEQWRSPVPLERVSPWLRQATVAVEDERFWSHRGIDSAAVVRAAGQNTLALRTRSGASTLTMQVCRMMDERPRTWRAKVVETFRALQLERIKSKAQILEAYLNTAPYGGNLRGAEAASRAYFGKAAADLSLGEAALLAGLPQSPARYRPDRYPRAAKARRAHVLACMVKCRIVSEEQARLAGEEPVETGPARLTLEGTQSLHAAWLAVQRRPQGGRTTIAPSIQTQVSRLAGRHGRKLPRGTQLAVVVIDISAGEIVAMVGSVDPAGNVEGQVNGALARRSPGSALKPFVYAAAFEAGLLNAESTVYDLPVERAGWSPKDFDEGFAGQISAGEALRQSLNVPAILVAEGTGLARCVGLVEAAGVQLPSDVQSRGGLAVVVGSIEVTLLDLVNGYATLGRGGIRSRARLFADEPAAPARVLSAEVCAAIDDILSSRRRRPKGMEDRAEGDVPWFMWKTGTSSGRRDAWAVGHNRRFAAGVWVGRFSGAGSPEFVGSEAAEPLLAAVFDLPSLRRVDGPPSPPQLTVRTPLSPPAEITGPLRILAPSAGSNFVAVNGTAIVHARANRQGELTWFLNGVLLESKEPGRRLVLAAGEYELRCVASSGEAAGARFQVRATIRPADSQGSSHLAGIGACSRVRLGDQNSNWAEQP